MLYHTVSMGEQLGGDCALHGNKQSGMASFVLYLRRLSPPPLTFIAYTKAEVCYLGTGGTSC